MYGQASVRINELSRQEPLFISTRNQTYGHSLIVSDCFSSLSVDINYKIRL